MKRKKMSSEQFSLLLALNCLFNKAQEKTTKKEREELLRANSLLIQFITK